MSGGAYVDLRMFRSRRVPVNIATLKGAVANPKIPLAELRSIGTLRKERRFFANTAYIAEGFRILEESPLRRDIVRRAFLESPDSVRYVEHIKVLVSKKVLGLVGRFDHALVMVLDAEGKEVKMPLIIRYSAVHKEAISARAIFNMVYSNALMLPDTIKFSLLGTKHIILQLMGFDFARFNLRIVNFDLLNSFYLMGVSPAVGECCGVRVGNLVYQARVCPMGFRRSCGCMSAICTSCILKRNPGESDLGVEPSELTRTDVPGFIPLRDGGGIFIIYDSVLVIAEEAIAAQWHKRLDRNFTQAGLALKYNILNALVGSTSYGGIRLRTDRNGLYWSVELASIITWHSVVAEELVPSPRSLFRVTGWLRFAAPILGWPDCKLGRLTKAQSRLGQVLESEWDVPCVDPMVMSTATTLVRSVRIITDENGEQHGEEFHRRSHVIKRSRGQPFFFAVDATPSRWTVYEITENGTPVLWRAAYFGGDFDALGNWIPSIEGSTAVGPDIWDIDEAESFAMLQGIRLGHSRGASLLVCANDNQVVGWNYTNGYAKNEVFDAHIVEAYTDGECTLVIVDIPTKENYVDVGTRVDLIYPTAGVGSLHYRQKATWERLKEAHVFWRTTGRNYLTRNASQYAPTNDDICKEPEDELSSEEF